MLTAWQQVSYFMPKTPNEIVNEYVLYNNNIRIRNKVIQSKFIKLPNLKIFDILDNDYNFLALGNISRNLEVNITQIKYNSIMSAIPTMW